MRVQVQLGADVVPVGEAALLDPGHVPHQVRAVLLHELLQRVLDLVRDEVDLGQHGERHAVQLLFLEAEGEI